MIRELYISGYRSIRNLRLPLGSLNVVTGANGSGKTNLYRAVHLIADAAHGGLARALAAEGGMPSALWAGPPRSKGPVRMVLGVATDDVSYELACGLPQPGPSVFRRDPEVKEEALWHGPHRTPSRTWLHRKGHSAWVRNRDHQRTDYPLALVNSESVLSQLREPHLYPELAALREEIRGWRFYHHFRSDIEAPARHPRPGVTTPVLSDDGSDLAAALQTIREIGDRDRLGRAVESAFPGAELCVEVDEQKTVLWLEMQFPGLTRRLDAREFSDGTLRFLCLTALLLSPRPPSLLALNEPETSLHPDLLGPLAQLIVDASEHSQVWVTTHSQALAGHLERTGGTCPIALELVEGDTRVRLPT